jgi:Fic family protein|tara:strand:+ start:234 stop:1289 length:1056 start_codon:yes stop_codon:yes gene_type:complete
MNNNIFAPHHTITPAIASALEGIERQLWLVDHMLLMPKHEAWLRREIRVKRAVGTTRIEGATLDEPAVRNLLGGSGVRNPTPDEQANINALQAYEFIDFLSDQADIPIDELVIRQLNRYFMTGAPETVTPGVYRKGHNTVGNYKPPDQGDVPSLMRSFAVWLRQDTDEIHPVARAGIGHIHMVAIHPFWDANGRTARGLSTLILQRSPFGFRKLLSLESYLFDDRHSYFTAIERTLGTNFSHEYDATPWLEFFALALRRHVSEFVAGLTDWHRMMQDLYAWGMEGGLLERQMDGHAFAIRTGRITRPEYIEITGVSPVTASRDLAQLVRVGVLIPEGKTRARIYRPATRPG